MIPVIYQHDILMKYYEKVHKSVNKTVASNFVHSKYPCVISTRALRRVISILPLAEDFDENSINYDPSKLEVGSSLITVKAKDTNKVMRKLRALGYSPRLPKRSKNCVLVNVRGFEDIEMIRRELDESIADYIGVSLINYTYRTGKLIKILKLAESSKLVLNIKNKSVDGYVYGVKLKVFQRGTISVSGGIRKEVAERIIKEALYVIEKTGAWL